METAVIALNSKFSWSGGSWGTNVIIFDVNLISACWIKNKNGDILVLGEGPTEDLDDTKVTAEVVNFTQTGETILLSLYYNGTNSFYLLMQ